LGRERRACLQRRQPFADRMARQHQLRLAPVVGQHQRAHRVQPAARDDTRREALPMPPLSWKLDMPRPAPTEPCATSAPALSKACR
jgi:hypothetical protein